MWARPLSNELRRRRKATQFYLDFFGACHPREGGKEVGITEVIAYKWHILRMARLSEQYLGLVTQHNHIILWVF